MVPPASAKRLRLARTARATTIGTARTGRGSAGSKTFYVKLTRRAKARLRRARIVKPVLQVRATDPQGNARTVRVRITIRR